MIIPDSSISTELIFLGTGTSSSIPHIECLTNPTTGPAQRPPCKTCLSTMNPDGKKNIRRNTSVALKIPAKDDLNRTITIVIDTGKNFQAAALEWFPKYGLRKIDALLITHAHADAMNGLDDLRGWTLNAAIQSHIDVYVSEATYAQVKSTFPYLVAKEYASGGGDVPEFRWHIINDKVPFEILDTGIMVTPFNVHHGRIFSQPNGPGGPENIQPYLCYGFKIEDYIAYISDVSHIPQDVWTLLGSRSSADCRPLPVVVLDCLRLHPHTSHVGLGDSITLARKIKASRTYWTGFSHDVGHDEYITLGEIVGGAKRESSGLTEIELKGSALIDEAHGNRIWVRPAHDGLRVFLNHEKGEVVDETYM